MKSKTKKNWKNELRKLHIQLLQIINRDKYEDRLEWERVATKVEDTRINWIKQTVKQFNIGIRDAYNKCREEYETSFNDHWPLNGEIRN